MDVKRTGISLSPNNSRVVMRPFEPTTAQRFEKIIARVSALTEPEVETLLEVVMGDFRNIQASRSAPLFQPHSACGSQGSPLC